MKKMLILGLLLIGIPSLYSQQTITPDLYRRINYNVLQLISDYDLLCKPGVINSDEKFYNLFSENAKIYNDFLPENKNQYISPADYYSLLSKRDNTKIEIEIWRVAFDELMKPCENGFLYKVSLKKAVNITNWNNIVYPRIEFPLIFHILVNKDSKTCRIDSITCDQPLVDFSLLKINRSKIDRDGIYIDIKGEKNVITCHKSDTILFLPEVSKPANDVKFESFDYNIKIETDTFPDKDSNVHFMILKPLKNALGFDSSYGLAEMYKMNALENQNSSILKNISSKSTGYSFGLNYQRKLKNWNFSNLIFVTGLNLDLEKIEFEGNYSTEFNSLDSDGDNYIRRIELNNIKEKIDLLSFRLPLGLQYHLFFNKKFGIFTTLGVNMNYLFLQNSNVTADASYKGYYPQFDNLVMDHYYDFGYNTLVLKQQNLGIQNLIFSYFVKGGFIYRINKSYNIQMGVQYTNGLNNLSTEKTNYHLSEKKDDFLSIYHAYQSIYKNNLSLNIHLMYNF